MKGSVVSFGFKHGVPDGYVVLDCRSIRNPHHDRQLRALTGLDKPVQTEVMGHPTARAILYYARLLVAAGVPVAFGCHAGRHRSVTLAEACKDIAEVKHLELVK